MLAYDIRINNRFDICVLRVTTVSCDIPKLSNYFDLDTTTLQRNSLGLSKYIKCVGYIVRMYIISSLFNLHKIYKAVQTLCQLESKIL